MPKAHIASRLGLQRETVHLWIKGILDYELVGFLDIYSKAKKGPRVKRQVDPILKRWIWEIREREMDCCGCGCGASIIFEIKRKYYKKTDRWAEYTYARSSKRCSKCIQKGIDLAELERQLDEKIAPVTIDEETWRLGIKLLNAKYESEAKQRAQVVESRQRQNQRLQSELDGYFKMRAREEMTAEEFTAKKRAIFEEQARLKEKIDDGINGQRSWLELAEDFFTTAYQAREMLNSDDLEAKRRAVAKIGWNVLLKDEKLVWTYQKPYDILLKPQYRSDLRRGWDSNPRGACAPGSFQNYCTRPLCDPSLCGGYRIRTCVTFLPTV